MRVSVITVAFQCEEGITRTIESVLAQDYPVMEYWLIEGAGTDRTLEITKEYSSRFQEKGIAYHIVSEPDEGIYDAMNKGISLATGEIIGMINGGDTYEPDTVSTAVKTFHETGCEILFGNINVYTLKGKRILKRAKKRLFYQTSRHWNHPSMFVKTELYKQYPFPRKGIHDDYAFYLKMLKQNRNIVVVNKTMAGFYMGGASNQRNGKAAWKRIQDRYRYCYRENGYSRWYLLECIFMEAAKWILG